MDAFRNYEDPFMSNLFNNLNVPMLDVGDRIGDTDYIDYIKLDELICPVMKGIDLLLRPFIVIKFVIEGQIRHQTFFQRYTNNEHFWITSNTFGTIPLMDSYGGMKMNQEEFLKSLIENGHKTITYDIYPILESDLGKQVDLFDEEKWNASIIIQRMWRKCRYNPDYKMCEKVTMHNHFDIEDKFGRTIVENNN